MSGGVMALFGVCLGTAILELALPGEEREAPRRLLHFFAALLVLLLILRPLLGLPDQVEGLGGEWIEIGDAGVYEDVLQEAVTKRSKEQLRQGLLALLESEFGITAEQCEIAVQTAEGGALRRIAVVLKGGGLLCDPRAIEKRLQELFSCEVEVR